MSETGVSAEARAGLDAVDTFPRQKARTRNFTLGTPRDFSVAADGSRVLFLRSPAGDDPQTALWAYDVREDREHLVADPKDLTGGRVAGELSTEERARRERKRESAEGIVAYSADADGRMAAFALAGSLYVADVPAGTVRELDVPTPALEPRLDTTGTRVAFVHDRALHVVDAAGRAATRLVGECEPTVTWGLAEFIAAEEMGRDRGYWWAPDGKSLLAARVDEAPVQVWWIADPADPAAEPRAVRYPAAGSANASVTLHFFPVQGGATVDVEWDRARYPYLAAVHWDERGPLVTIQSRDQRSALVVSVDPESGSTTQIDSQDDETWVDLVPGVPRRLADGRLVTATHAGDSTSLAVNGSSVTPPGMELRAVLDVAGDRVVFTASEDPVEVHVWRWAARDGLSRITTEAGVHSALPRGDVCVLGSSGLDHHGTRWTVGDHVFTPQAETPLITPAVQLLTVGDDALRVGVVLPRDHQPGTPLPVLLDPYGGPGRQRVLAARQAWLEAQWLADQGFAVVVADGRGTPGRGRSWSRAIAGDLAGPTLEDQAAALSAVAALGFDLDLSRVAIRGWSFGGYLAALAVLRLPDLFHAAVAGAPVTDWRLYDTHYSERYLGTAPDGSDRPAYDRSSLLADAARLRRPLMLIHGLADDNVFVAHTLQLSRLLVHSRRPHSVLPLTGVTHMTPQEKVAENLLLLQVDFLKRSLGLS